MESGPLPTSAGRPSRNPSRLSSKKRKWARSMMKSPQIPPVHGPEAKGRIAELSRGRSCGVIRASDGQRVFFTAAIWKALGTMTWRSAYWCSSS